jgi:hypothetical protein
MGNPTNGTDAVEEAAGQTQREERCRLFGPTRAFYGIASRAARESAHFF